MESSTALRLIESAHEKALFSTRVLSAREKEFLKNVMVLAERPGFTGLSQKQGAWLSRIVQKLDAAAAQRNARFNRYRGAYLSACFGR